MFASLLGFDFQFTWGGVASVALGLLIWFVGLISRELSEWIIVRARGPKLSLEIEATHTPTSPSGEAIYARVKVMNTKARLARKCRAYLICVEAWNEQTNAFEATSYREAIPLIWSYDRKIDAVDIPWGIDRYVDIFELVPTRIGVVPQFWKSDGEIPWILQYESIFRGRGKNRYKIAVTADDIPPKYKSFVITWNDYWPPIIET